MNTAALLYVCWFPLTIMKFIQDMRCMFFVLCSGEQFAYYILYIIRYIVVYHSLHYFDEERNRSMDSTANI